MKRNVLLALGIFLCALLLFSPSAYAFSTIFAYGDSLTDDGTSTYDPFGFQRFTDGDEVWVETLASTMGCSLIDVAYGGATTGYDNPAAGLPITGLQWQLENTVPTPLFSSLNLDDTLFTVWAGANDFFQNRDYLTAVGNIGIGLNTLAMAGATSILVPNLPDLGLIPAYYLAGAEASALASDWTENFNQELKSALWTFAACNTEIDLYYMDVFGLFNDYILDENGNIADPASWEALFWYDGVHPSSIGHGLIAEEAYSTLLAGPVPEPSTIVLLGLGLIGLAGYGRRKFIK